MRYPSSFLLSIDAWMLCSFLFLTMLGCIYCGSVIGRKKSQKGNYVENTANKTIFGSVFGLGAFLLAFTFSMSSARFESRRSATIEEAGAIATAVRRADLYPANERLAFREDFKSYLRARIAYNTGGRNPEKLEAIHATQEKFERKLWARAMRLSVNAESIIPSNQMITTLDDMFVASTKSDYAELSRVPESIIIMLFILSLVSAIFVGYISDEKGDLDWHVAIGFCFLSAMVMYITLDLDRPRRGIIKLESSQQALILLMEEFK